MSSSDIDHSLTEWLDAARKAAGSPSLRAIAERTDYSHTTVAKVFSLAATGVAWPVIEQVCCALDADPADARRLLAAPAAPQRVAGTVENASPSAQRLPLLVSCALLVCGAVILVVMQAVDNDTSRSTTITDAVQILFMFGASTQFFLRAVRSRRLADRRNFLFFTLLVAGTGSWALGAVGWFVERHVFHNGIPRGYLHDVGFLIMPICIGAALWLRANRYGLARLQSSWQTAATWVVLIAAPYVLIVLLLVALRLRSDGTALLYAVYPATDIALSFIALVPLVCGHRIVASGILCVGLLANAASDVGYLLIRADPSKSEFPPSAALGYVVLAAVMVLYGLLGRPLPEQVRPLVPIRVRWTISPRAVIAISGAIAAVVALIGAATGIWVTPSTETRSVMLAVVGLVACTLAVTGILSTAVDPTERDPSTKS